MGNNSSRKRDNEELKNWVGVVNKTMIDLAKYIDSIQALADTFKRRFEKLDSESTDDDSSNTGKLYEKQVNMYESAIPLLAKIEAAQNQKKYTMESVNNFLRFFMKKVDKIYKTRVDDFNNRSLDTYLADSESATPNYKQRAKTTKIPEEHLFQSKALDMHSKVPKLEEECAHIEGKVQCLSTNNTHKATVKTKFQSRNTGAEQEMTSKLARCTGPDAREIMTEDTENITEDVQTHQQVAKLQTENESLRLTIVQLKQQVSITKSELERSILNNSSLNEQINREKINMEEKNRMMREMKRCISELETENQIQEEKSAAALDGANMKIIELEKTNHTVQQDNKTLNLELQKLVNKKSLQVQIYCQQRGDLISTIEAELMSLLKTRMSLTNMELEFRQCVTQSSIKHDTPLLVLCVMASRLGTDVSNAIQGITLTSRMAVLIFHHKDVYALPSQASERVLTGPQFTLLGVSRRSERTLIQHHYTYYCHVHMALCSKKIYSSHMKGLYALPTVSMINMVRITMVNNAYVAIHETNLQNKSGTIN